MSFAQNPFFSPKIPQNHVWVFKIFIFKFFVSPFEYLGLIAKLPNHGNFRRPNTLNSPKNIFGVFYFLLVENIPLLKMALIDKNSRRITKWILPAT